MANATKAILAQVDDHERLLKEEQLVEAERRKVMMQQAKADEKREMERKASLKARGLKHQQELADQMRLQKADHFRDPNCAEMTPLESVLNRSLLVSMHQHSFDGAHVLN